MCACSQSRLCELLREQSGKTLKGFVMLGGLCWLKGGGQSPEADPECGAVHMQQNNMEKLRQAAVKA